MSDMVLCFPSTSRDGPGRCGEHQILGAHPSAVVRAQPAVVTQSARAPQTQLLTSLGVVTQSHIPPELVTHVHSHQGSQRSQPWSTGQEALELRGREWAQRNAELLRALKRTRSDDRRLSERAQRSTAAQLPAVLAGDLQPLADELFHANGHGKVRS